MKNDGESWTRPRFSKVFTDFGDFLYIAPSLVADHNHFIALKVPALSVHTLHKEHRRYNFLWKGNVPILVYAAFLIPCRLVPKLFTLFELCRGPNWNPGLYNERNAVSSLNLHYRVRDIRVAPN